MCSVGNLWVFLNGCNFRGIETNSTNYLFFFITFIFPALSLLSILSQVIPLCAKRRHKTMILSFNFNRFWPIELRDGRTYGRATAFYSVL